MFLDWWRKLIRVESKASRRERRKPPHLRRARFKPWSEVLEDRIVPAGFGPNDFLVADSANGRIVDYDANFHFKGYVDANFPHVIGMDFLPSGALVAVSQEWKVREYAPTGGLVRSFRTASTTDGGPTEIKADSSGNLFIATNSDYGVLKYTQYGTFVGEFFHTASAYGYPPWYVGTAVLPNGQLWAQAPYSPDPSHRNPIDVYDARSTGFINSPTGSISLDSDNTHQDDAQSMFYSSSTNTVLMVGYDSWEQVGTVYERDTAGSLVRRFDQVGSTVKGGVTRGPNNQVYATDYFQKAVDIWSPGGTFLGSVGIAGTNTSPEGIVWTGNAPQALTMGLTSSAAAPLYGQEITFTANVHTPAPGLGVPTGSVTFSIDGVPRVSTPLNGSGQATFKIASLGVGAHSVTAAYGGDVNFFPISASSTQAVSKDTTTTAARSLLNPSLTGQVLTVAATVTADAPGAGTATGTVDFLDLTTSTPLGSAALDHGTAKLQVGPLALGSHNIRATYRGDGNFFTSNASFLQTVQGPNLTTDRLAVGGAAGTVVQNTGAWSDTVPGATLTLKASVGSVVPGADGTWTWSYTVPPGGALNTPVTIAGRDDQGATASTVFSLNPTSFLVTNTNSSGPGSLYQAYLDAITSPSGSPSLISFAPGLSGTITLPAGTLDIPRDVSFNGPGSGQLTVTGASFRIEPGVSASFSDLTLQNPGSWLIDNEGELKLNGCVIQNSGVPGFNETPALLSWGRMEVAHCLLTANPGGAIHNGDTGWTTVLDCTISANGPSNRSTDTVYNGGTLEVFNSTITQNFGPGITNREFGTVTVRDSTISRNQGVGISVLDGALVLSGSTIADNTNNLYHDTARSGAGTNTDGHDSGGGIYNFGTATVVNCTISGNSSTGSGGGICNNGTMTVCNSTIAGNSAALAGGGISTVDSLRLTNVTVAWNTCDDGYGGGLALTSFREGSPFPFLSNTIVADNMARDGTVSTPNDIAGAVNLASVYNLIGVGGAGGLQDRSIDPVHHNIVLAGDTSGGGPGDPGLRGLGDYGGPMLTVGLAYYSPALGNGNPDLALDPDGNPLTTDQRGFLRTYSRSIGAFEAQPVTFTVTNLNDTGPGSLRSYVEANLDIGYPFPNTITFAPGLTGTITLTQELVVAFGLTIIGPGADRLAISGNHGSRVFQVYGDGIAPPPVSISGLTIKDGVGNPGWIIDGQPDINGGGILNEGPLTLSDCVVTGNVTPGNGGAIFNSGTLVLERTTIVNNSGGRGGGIENLGTLTVRNSTIAGNSGLAGGGICNDGILDANNNTLSAGILTLSNSTIAGNSAAHGGGLATAFASTLWVTNTTIAGNFAALGGGISDGGASISVANTIVANNLNSSGNPDDIKGADTFRGVYNLVGTGGSGGIQDGVFGNRVGVSSASLGLAPLGDYGGPTQTMALLPGSLAIGNGSVPQANQAGLTTDQRGYDRVYGGSIDIGAFERAPVTYTVTNLNTSGPGSLSYFLAIDRQLSLGGQIDFTASSDADVTAFLNLVNQLPGSVSPHIDVLLYLPSGKDLSGFNASPPSGMKVTIIGDGTQKVFGHSPTLTVSSGDVVVIGVSFVQTTSAPAILLTGGSLTLRDDVVQQNSGGGQPAFSLAGGSLDLGTAKDPGGNTVNLTGSNPLLANLGASLVVPVGDAFSLDGAPLTTPQAADYAYDVNENDVLRVRGLGLLTDDFDPRGGPLTAILAGGPAHGAVSLNADGSFTYTPAADYAGTDSFTYEARAADGTLSAPATVNLSVNVVASRLVVTGLPAATDLQAPLSFTVAAEDASGRVVTDYAGKIHFTSTDHQAVLPADFTFSPADGGVKTFTPGASFNTAGFQTLTATDAAPGTVHGDAVVFVNPRPVSWTGAAGDNDWDTPGNWSVNAVPGRNDAVTIDLPGRNTFTVTHSSTVSDAVYSLTSQDALNISAGSLSLGSASTVTDLTLSRGTLTGSGDLYVGGRLDWSSGTISGGGTLYLGAGSTAFLGAGTLGRPLDNAGRLQQSGTLQMAAGVTLTNEAGATVDIVGGNVYGEASSLLVNRGTVLAHNSNNTLSEIFVPFDNAAGGVVRVQSARLRFTRGGAGDGSFLGDPGTELWFYGLGFGAGSSIDAATVRFLQAPAGVAGPYNSPAAVAGYYRAVLTDIEAGVSVSFTGGVDLAGGDLTVSGGTADFTGASLRSPLSFRNLTLSGGTLTGTADVHVTGQLSWPTGTVGGTGALYVDAGAVGSLGGGTLGRPLDNAGRLQQSGTLQMAAGVTLTNEAGATVDIVGGNVYGEASSLLVNRGTVLAHNSNNTLSEIFVPFDNAAGGVVRVQSARLRFTRGGAGDGSFLGDPGTELWFYGLGFGAGSSIDAATVRFLQAPAGVAGSYHAAAGTEVGAAVTMTDTVAGLGSLTIDTGASLDLTAATLAPGATTLPALTLAGTLVRADDFTVTGSFAWNGGTLTANGGHGSLTAQAGMTLTGSPTLDGYALTNPAGQTATLNADGLQLRRGAVFANSGSVDDQSNVNLDGDAASRFVNAGAFTKSGSNGPGFYTFITAAFTNDGALDVQRGRVVLGDGLPFLNNGALRGETGSLLTFNGPAVTFGPGSVIDADRVQFDAAAVVAGSYRANSTEVRGSAFRIPASTLAFTGAVAGLGSLTVDGGRTLDLTAAALAPGATTLPALTLTGTLVRADSFTVAGQLTWNGGTLSAAGGSGSLTAQNGMTLTGTDTLDGYTVINPTGQTAVLDAGRVQAVQGAAFTNYGILDDRSNVLLTGDGSSAFTNFGAFTKSGSDDPAGNFYTTVSAPFSNYGTLDVQTGRVVLDGTFANDGTIQGETGSLLTFGGTGTFAPGSALSGDRIQFDAAAVVAGSYQANSTEVRGSAFRIPASTLAFTGAVAGLGSLAIDGGRTLNLTQARPAAPGPIPATSVSLLGTLMGGGRLSLNDTGDYTQTSAGTLAETLGRDAAGSRYDQVNVAGTLSLAGQLNLGLAAGFVPRLHETFQVVNNQGAGPALGTFSGLPEGGVIALGKNQFQISYRGGDGNDVVLTAIATANQPPTAKAGGPYAIREGDSLGLDASASSDPDGDPLTYSWDVNGDGAFGDATGARPALTWAQLGALAPPVNDGPRAFTVKVRVDDGQGGADTAAATLTVLNAAPALTAPPDQSAYPGAARVFDLGSFTDPGADDPWTVRVDWGDGLGDSFTAAPGGLSRSHTYAAAGVYPVTETVSDKDGDSDTRTFQAFVGTVVRNTGDSGPGSLRDVLTLANANAGRDFITFAIPGAGAHTIRPLSLLPVITDPVLLDGWSQGGAGYQGPPLVELDGSALPKTGVSLGTYGLKITAGGSTVRGLVLNRFIDAVPSVAVWLAGAGGNVVQGNYIGTDVTGTRTYNGAALTALSPLNTGYGVYVEGSSNNLIGTDDPNDAAGRNVIAGVSWGVATSVGAGGRPSSDNVMAGNYIGTDATGSVALGTFAGVGLVGDNHESIRDNVIAAGVYGILVGAQSRVTLPVSQVEITANLIGVDAAGRVRAGFGNSAYGVDVNGASLVQVGGVAAGQGNVIASSGKAAVGVTNGNGGPGTGNAVRGNAIFGNSGAGIDLGNNGVTANDDGDGDADAGPNNLQNYPVLVGSVAGATTSVGGALHTTPGGTFTIDFYASPSADASGHGPGQRYLGSAAVTADGKGVATFVADGLGPTSAGEVISATATDAAGNTSEFSADVTAAALTASAGGPYAIAYGDSLTLDGSGPVNPAGGGLSYTWSVTGHADAASGSSPTLSWSQLAALGVRTGQAVAVIVRVDDGHGHAAEAQTTLTVQKAAPDVTVVPYAATYDGQAHGPSGAAKGVLGEDLGALLDLGATERNAGHYDVAWSFAGDDNYRAAGGISAVDITPRTLHVSATADARVYDGTAAAVAHLTDDRVDGDVFSDGYASAAFGDKKAGVRKTVLVSGISTSGADAGNYALAADSATAAADITPLAVTGAITAANKVYDGGVGATITERTLTGVLAGDDVSYVGGAATFDTKNVGTGKTVIATALGLWGADAGNYTVNASATAAADISRRDLTVSATADGKVYDGTTASTAHLTDDRVAGDALTESYASAAFADKNAGTGKTVTVSGISISGADAGNYRLVSTLATATADIARAATTTGLTASATTPLFGVDVVTFTATVTATPGDFTGTVDFYDNTTHTDLGRVAVVNGVASLSAGGLAVGGHAVTATYGGDGNFLSSSADAALTVIPPASLSGAAFEDFNADGLVDFGEQGIAAVTVTLTGTDDLGRAVRLSRSTDGAGAYFFVNLRPGDYTLTETQPAGYLQGIDSVGTAGGSLVAVDQFAVRLGQGVDGLNYNYGERPTDTGRVHRGQTASVTFWRNKKGQDLIKNLNGGGAAGHGAHQLGDWLAATLPNVYGANAGSNNLASWDNAAVAGLFLQAGAKQSLDGDVLATALSVYVTNATLNPLDPTTGSNLATDNGFTVSGDGVGAATVNVGTNGAAFGVADGSTLTVLDLLLATDRKSKNGDLYGASAGSDYARMRALADNVYSALIKDGDVSGGKK